MIFTRPLAGSAARPARLGHRPGRGRDRRRGAEPSCGRCWPGSPAAPRRAGSLPQTALFGPEVGLDSLTGTLLLVEIQQRFGVDVAAEDLNLDSLASLATLATFLAAHG